MVNTLDLCSRWMRSSIYGSVYQSLVVIAFRPMQSMHICSPEASSFFNKDHWYCELGLAVCNLAIGQTCGNLGFKLQALWIRHPIQLVMRQHYNWIGVDEKVILRSWTDSRCRFEVICKRLRDALPPRFKVCRLVWSSLRLLLHYLVDTYPNHDTQDFWRLALRDKERGDHVDRWSTGHWLAMSLNFSQLSLVMLQPYKWCHGEPCCNLVESGSSICTVLVLWWMICRLAAVQSLPWIRS